MIARVHSSSSRPCATPPPTPRPRRTSCSCAAASSGRSAPGSGRSCRSAGACTRRSSRSSARRSTRSAARRCSCPVLTPAELWEQTGASRCRSSSGSRTGRAPVRAADVARGDDDVPRARDPVYKQLPQILVPLLDQGARRAAPARRPPPRARVHHEGLVLVRPRRGGARRELPASTPRRTSGSSSAAGSRRTSSRRSPGSWAATSRSTSSRRPGPGENELVRCENGDYFADIEVAARRPACARVPERARRARARSRRRASATIEALAEFLGIDAAATSKAMPVVTRRRRVVLGARARRRPAQRGEAGGGLRGDVPAGDRGARSARRSARAAARIGPVGVTVEVIADEALREGQFVAGANRDGWHLRGVEAGRDYEPRFADIRQAREGDACPTLRRAAALPDRDRGRAHLQARHALLRAARRDLPRRGRQREADRHGQLRHRARADASPRSSSSTTTSTGSCGRASSRPYDVARRRRCPASRSAPRRSSSALGDAGLDRARRRPRPARGREVRRRRPDRHARAGHRRPEDARGRRRRRARRGRPARSAACPSTSWRTPSARR